METFFAYIIFSPSLNTFYVGHTSNLQERLIQHNSGISTFTARSNDWELKWKKSFNSREEARAEEKRIKAKKSKKYIEWLISSPDSYQDG